MEAYSYGKAESPLWVEPGRPPSMTDFGALRKFNSVLAGFRFCPLGGNYSSMISSAPPRIAGGIVKPCACAVFKLITSWNLFGCSTGRSAA
jgi:hypothetical protein